MGNHISVIPTWFNFRDISSVTPELADTGMMSTDMKCLFHLFQYFDIDYSMYVYSDHWKWHLCDFITQLYYEYYTKLLEYICFDV